MSEMRARMIADEELSDQLFEERAYRIALEAHEDRLKLWETVENLRDALQLIANQTICPDLFPGETNEDVLFGKTAVVTAIAALEVSLGSPAQRSSDDTR